MIGINGSMAAFSGQATPASIYGASLKRWFKENFTSGTQTFVDEQGNGNATASTGTVTAGTVNGHTTMVLDGSSGLTLGDITDVDGKTEITIFSCFKANATDMSSHPYGSMFAKLYGSVAFHLGSNGSGDRVTGAVDADFSTNDATSNANYYDDTWHHAIYTWNSTDGGVIYIDGAAQTITEPAGVTSIPDITEPATLGHVSTGASYSYFFQGELTNLGLVDRYSTTADVAKLSAYLKSFLGI